MGDFDPTPIPTDYAGALLSFIHLRSHLPRQEPCSDADSVIEHLAA